MSSITIEAELDLDVIAEEVIDLIERGSTIEDAVGVIVEDKMSEIEDRLERIEDALANISQAANI